MMNRMLHLTGGAAILLAILLFTASDAGAARFTIGDQVESIATNLNCRAGSGLSAAVLGVHHTGDRGAVLAGPRFANGYTWWYIDWATGADGWSADRYLRTISPVNSTPAAPHATSSIDVSPTNMGSGSSAPAFTPSSAPPAPVPPSTITHIPVPPPASGSNARVSFDGDGHVLMHGVPRFILGVYDSGLGFSTNESSYEQAIFAPDGERKLDGIPLNFYLNYYYGSASVPALTALMNVLQRHGMMYWQTANSFTDGSYTRYDNADGPAFTIDKSPTNIKQLAAHPGYAGVYLADEPDDMLHEETVAHTSRILATDPNSVNFIALINSYYRDLTKWADIPGLIAIDPYSMVGSHNSHYWVADSVARLRKAVDGSRPIVAINQFFQFQSSPFPNYAQLKTNAVMSIVEGAQGIVWWSVGTAGLGRSDDATHTAAMADLKRLTTVLNGLEPVLLAAPASEALAGNSTCTGDTVVWREAALRHNLQVEWLQSAKDAFNGELRALQNGDTSQSYLLNQSCDVRTLVKVVDGKGYVFAYNYTDKNIGPVTFTWQNSINGVGVIDESRDLTPSDSHFSDSFGPYESHMYLITESGMNVSIPHSSSPAASAEPPAALSAADSTVVPAQVNESANVDTNTNKDTCTAESAASFSADFQYPAPNAKVGGSQTVGIQTTADWGKPKTVTISLDCDPGQTLLDETMTGSVEWIQWDTARVPNGSHILTLSVTYNNETIRTLLPVIVSN